MGLDLVEVVMEVEDRFGTAIFDERAERIRTAGEMADHVAARLGQRDSIACPTANVFYRFRRALMDCLHVKREDARLSGSLGELIPRRGRKTCWQRLGRSAGLQMPSLTFPDWLTISFRWLLWLTVPVFLASLVWAMWIGLPPWVPIPYWMLGVFALVLAAWAASPLAICFPADCRTISGAVTSIVRANYGDHEKREQSWTNDQVWDAVREILAKYTNVPPDSIHRNSDLVYDLGLG